eukprot:7442836-Lingulodinium_polyedra.AAC.1
MSEVGDRHWVHRYLRVPSNHHGRPNLCQPPVGDEHPSLSQVLAAVGDVCGVDVLPVGGCKRAL